MSFQTMPFIFLNMGGEMAYILEQRLQAQNVGDEKSGKVLGDIITTMFKRSFLDELFKPQRIYTRNSLREYFEQVAHSSVMRLNEQSMDKLFDLMIMAIKFQVLLCKEPSELVLITMNHLDGVKSMFKDQPKVVESIEYANSLLMDNFGDTPMWQMAAIRSEILNFLLGARVKVSLMLRNGSQMDDGRFVLFPAGEQIELPYNAVRPGTVRYINHAGDVHKTDEFEVAEKFKVAPNQERTMIRGTTLGRNMYKIGEGTGQMKVSSGELADPEFAGPDRPSGNELELLSMLLKSGKETGEGQFDLILFEDDDEDNKGGGFLRNDDIDNDAEKATKEKEKASSTAKKLPTKKSLSKAINELDLKPKDDAPSDRPPTSGSNSGAKKAPVARKASAGAKGAKGRDLLQMMDEAAAEKPAPTPAKGLARKGSAKRNPQ